MCEKENLTEAFNAIFTRGINIANKESMNLVFKQKLILIVIISLNG